MNRTCLLALFLSLGLLASAQSVTLPYNPDVDQDSAIGAGDLLGLLPLFGNYFTPSEVLIDGETLTDYIAALEEAAANATSDTVTLPMLPGTTPGEMLYWDGAQWSLVPTGLSGQALLLDGSIPTWKELRTGCTDSVFLEFDPAATVNDGSCLTPIVLGCTDAQFVEFDPDANVNDGTCATPDTGCSSVEFDGYVYTAVEIGDQCWFAENLRTTHYANGESISQVTDNGVWTGLTSGARCDYGNDTGNVEMYGRLYNWYAATHDSGLCPNGWHVPTDSEWTELETYIASQGYTGMEGDALKTTTGWASNGNGTDDFGFSGLPGGARLHNTGGFSVAGSDGYWWSSSSSGNNAWSRGLDYGNPVIARNVYNPRSGFSVRCLEDTPLQGCTDSSFIEFNPSAELDNGSCQTPLALGCTDSLYVEFDPLANVDDGSCLTLAPIEWACGDSISYWGSTYATVIIGDQCWFAENLRSEFFNNGDSILNVEDDSAWQALECGAYCNGTPAWCSYLNLDATIEGYGLLYNFYVVGDSREVCPVGWHVPSDTEWSNLEYFLGIPLPELSTNGWRGTNQGDIIKADSISTPSWNGANTLGWRGLPSGKRRPWFSDIESRAYYWTSTIVSAYGVATRQLWTDESRIYRGEQNKWSGYSIRCIKN